MSTVPLTYPVSLSSPPQEDAMVRHVALSDYCTLLALFLQVPTDQLVQSYKEGSPASDYQAIVSELHVPEDRAKKGLESLQAWQNNLNLDEDPLRSMRREHTRLFHHPKQPAILIYEGLFLDSERIRAGKESTHARMFVNSAAMDAERFYQKAGLKRSSNISLSADCITTELEFLGHLHEQSAKALLDGDMKTYELTTQLLVDFRTKHVDTWMPRFFSLCETESKHEFYRAAGILGTILLENEMVFSAIDPSYSLNDTDPSSPTSSGA